MSTGSAGAERAVLGCTGADEVGIAMLGRDGSRHVDRMPRRDLAAAVAARPGLRWVWSDTAAWYPPLLAAGVRVERCHDLRLAHAILARSAFVPDPAALQVAHEWAGPGASAGTGAADRAPALFDAADDAAVPDGLDEALAELGRHDAALAGSAQRRRLTLLVAAESAGALVAAELRTAGLPWDAAVHDRLLRDTLGERPAHGGPPRRLGAAATRVRDILGDPTLSLDSQPKLLRALHRAGVQVESTARWELAEHRHPVVAPLLEYKKLSRLLSANGWAWLAEWVHEGRFRPVYVPGGVVTGRWASSGGGALQLPRSLRAAVRADPGWLLVIADVAQLEPRVLAAMASDRAMARAARGHDLYAGVVEAGAVATRAEAKVAVLGAMYGATTGQSGRLVPRLRGAFPHAMALVDEAAQTGETGGAVTTWLGRTCPPVDEEWRRMQADAAGPDASDADRTRTVRRARDRGRFTRNFIVQGSAAEWALCWIAATRRRLDALPPAAVPAPASGRAFQDHAHLAFFLHDELVVHTPREQAEAVAHALAEAAAEAARLMFGDFPIDFPLGVRIARSAADAPDAPHAGANDPAVDGPEVSGS